MKKLRLLWFRVQVIRYGLHAFIYTGVNLYDDPTLSQIETIRKGSHQLPERYRHAHFSNPR